MAPRARAAVYLAILLAATLACAQADETYGVTGEDVYRIGTTVPQTKIDYTGTQHLSVARDNNGARFVAEATYTRTDDSGKATVHARFVQQMSKDGSFEDRVDEDPDFLTILNQPFAIQLDPTTMHDLQRLRGSVPFEATSPLGGARLHGYLRPAGKGRIQSVRSTGVRFSAQGPMTGTLPQHPEDSLNGTIRMDGTAYYSERDSLLVALDATLTIDGKLLNDNTAVPVRIVYHRTIRAGDGGAGFAEAKR
jgi:hypothetical protein